MSHRFQRSGLGWPGWQTTSLWCWVPRAQSDFHCLFRTALWRHKSGQFHDSSEPRSRCQRCRGRLVPCSAATPWSARARSHGTTLSPRWQTWDASPFHSIVCYTITNILWKALYIALQFVFQNRSPRMLNNNEKYDDETFCTGYLMLQRNTVYNTVRETLGFGNQSSGRAFCVL